ncbi:MAG: four helix bundle protein [Patescibacteria group bacterium]|nr:four helix bundle protein [Patescibacteria group bacterium]
MSISRFEDIIAWQKARELNKILYIALKQNRDYYYKDQILRASLSIMNNIAEGFGRKSEKEFIHFLSISNGSCNEVRSMLYLGLDFNYFDDKKFSELYKLTTEIGCIINGLSKSIKLNPTPRTRTKY